MSSIMELISTLWKFSSWKVSFLIAKRFWRRGILHSSSFEISLYFMFSLMYFGESSSNSQSSVSCKLKRFFPCLVFLSPVQRFPKRLITGFLLSIKDLWKVMNLEHNITFTCKQSEILSMKYLCVWCGSLKIVLMAMFQELEIFSHWLEKRLHRLLE